MRAFLRFFFGIKCKQSKDRTVHCVFAGPSVSWKDFGASLWVRAIPPGSGRAPCGRPLHRPGPPSPPGKVGGCPPPLAGRRSSRGSSAGRRWGWRRLCKPKPVLLMTPATQASSLSLAPACGTMYLKKNIRTSMLRKLQNVTLEVNKTSHDSENAHNQF